MKALPPINPDQKHDLPHSSCTLDIAKMPPKAPGLGAQVLSEIPEKCPGGQAQLQRAELPSLLCQRAAI
jgi:hypothetical protein